MLHSTLWNVTKEKHRPKASSFKIPADFDEQLERQIYGPSTQIAQNTVRPALRFGFLIYASICFTVIAYRSLCSYTLVAWRHLRKTNNKLIIT